METIFGQYLNCVVDYVEGQGVEKAILFGAIQASTNMKKRVFNSEEGAKDIKGKSLGGYSNPYKKKRKAKGRQTKKKDLEFTGSMRGSIREEIDNNGNIIGYLSSPTEQKKAGYIAKYQKTKGNTDIFRLNEKEWDKVFATADKIILNDIKNIANECSGVSQ